jgi:hypothetical protein
MRESELTQVCDDSSRVLLHLCSYSHGEKRFSQRRMCQTNELGVWGKAEKAVEGARSFSSLLSSFLFHAAMNFLSEFALT